MTVGPRTRASAPSRNCWPNTAVTRSAAHVVGAGVPRTRPKRLPRRSSRGSTRTAGACFPWRTPVTRNRNPPTRGRAGRHRRSRPRVRRRPSPLRKLPGDRCPAPPLLLRRGLRRRLNRAPPERGEFGSPRSRAAPRIGCGDGKRRWCVPVVPPGEVRLPRRAPTRRTTFSLLPPRSSRASAVRGPTGPPGRGRISGRPRSSRRGSFPRLSVTPDPGGSRRDGRRPGTDLTDRQWTPRSRLNSRRCPRPNRDVGHSPRATSLRAGRPPVRRPRAVRRWPVGTPLVSRRRRPPWCTSSPPNGSRP